MDSSNKNNNSIKEINKHIDQKNSYTFDEKSQAQQANESTTESTNQPTTNWRNKQIDALGQQADVPRDEPMLSEISYG